MFVVFPQKSIKQNPQASKTSIRLGEGHTAGRPQDEKRNFRRTLRQDAQAKNKIKSEIQCVESECVERDGLRQHVVVVGSTAEELQRTPERLSPWLIKPSGANLSLMQRYPTTYAKANAPQNSKGFRGSVRSASIPAHSQHWVERHLGLRLAPLARLVALVGRPEG